MNDDSSGSPERDINRGGPMPMSVINSLNEDLANQNKMIPGSNPDLTSMTGGMSGGGLVFGSANKMTELIAREQHFQQQILVLKQQQHLQQQILLQQFQQQQQVLAEQHEKQLQHHIKEYLELQKKVEDEQRMERERREREKLEQLRKKDKNEHNMSDYREIQYPLSMKKPCLSHASAIASSEVKQRLQEFVLSKKQREAAAANSANASPPNHVGSNWHPMLGKYDDDFPLRKTASEPNLKVRSIIKQKVIDRRSSPLLRRRDKGPIPLKRRQPIPTDTGSSTPDSGPNSPPNGITHQGSRSSSGSTPIQEEPPTTCPYGPLVTQGSLNDLTLYSSPSLPNISLGRPPIVTAAGVVNTSNAAAVVAAAAAAAAQTAAIDSGKMVPVSEAQLRAMAAARLGMPLTGHMLHSTLPFFPALPAVIDGDFTPPTSPVYIQQQMKTLEQQNRMAGGGASQGMYATPSHHPITDAQVAQARLHRSGHRPLGRTQSAPLPLGHPMLQPQNFILQQQQQQQHELFLKGKQLYEQQQHNLLKQHIRQTVLTRAGSKNHVENVEEETEAAIAQEMKDDQDNTQTHGAAAAARRSEPEVIDLTEKMHSGDASELIKQRRERETFLQQQRDLMLRHTLQASEGSAFSPAVRPHAARPLSRALSSPLVTLNAALSQSQSSQDNISSSSSKHIFTTGLVYDSLMLKHQCICADNSNHPEHSGRLQSIWARLQETGLAARCERVRSRKATLEEIQSCHSEAHSLLFGTNPLNRQKLDISKLADLPFKNFVMLPCGGIGVDSDTTWNELHTAGAAKMAVGCVIELAFKTLLGEIKNGLAVVRPPGHHADHNQAMGFCFFNSVAIAAKQLKQRLKVERILIVDWDVHHGNGTQQMFYDDPNVLYLSIHRHDDGNFFPGTGGPMELGVDEGVGYNVNIPWSGGLNPPMGDAEYLAAFRSVVMPVARQFDPDIVLVSCGFDAASGHPSPLGGYKVTPTCYSHMTRQLMQLANGKVVLALEGGYDLPAICDASQECVRALLGDDLAPLREEELVKKPCQNAIDTLQNVIAIQSQHWPVLKKYSHSVGYSLVEAQQKDREEADTVSALASLSVAHIQRQDSDSILIENRLNEVREEEEHETEGGASLNDVEPMDQDQESDKPAGK